MFGIGNELDMNENTPVDHGSFLRSMGKINHVLTLKRPVFLIKSSTFDSWQIHHLCWMHLQYDHHHHFLFFESPFLVVYPLVKPDT